MNNSVYTRIVTFLKEAICAPSSQWFSETASKYFGRDFDYQRIHRCLPSDCNERHKTNLLTAYFLVYIITSNYPDEIWGQAAYSTTFLFTFHCRTFIACGMIGDGIFVVEKNGVSEKSKGYQVITDGFSDVIQHAVLNVNTLKIAPCKMQLVFYKPSEISGIWMSSDGAVGITFEAINNVLLADRSSYTNLSSVFDDMRNRTKEEVYNRVLDLTLKFSRSNTSQGGRGDDCSIVFIKATN